MSSKSTYWRTQVNNTTTYKNRQGITEYKVRMQAGKEVFLDAKGVQLGYIDSQGRTMSKDNRILSWERRPDLILCQLRDE